MRQKVSCKWNHCIKRCQCWPGTDLARKGVFAKKHTHTYSTIHLYISYMHIRIYICMNLYNIYIYICLYIYIYIQISQTECACSRSQPTLTLVTICSSGKGSGSARGGRDFELVQAIRKRCGILCAGHTGWNISISDIYLISIFLQ